MFLSCQGMLPPVDEEALVDFDHLICVVFVNSDQNCSCFRERIKKLVKARDCYGLVFDKVERNKINMKKSQPNLLKSDVIDTLKENSLPLSIGKKKLLSVLVTR